MRAVLPQPGIHSETEQVQLQIENFGIRMTQLSFCELNYDEVRIGAVP